MSLQFGTGKTGMVDNTETGKGVCCDGNCNDTHGGHDGDVRSVIVTRAGSPEWEFNYCENAVAEDRSRGLTVTDLINK